MNIHEPGLMLYQTREYGYHEAVDMKRLKSEQKVLSLRCLLEDLDILFWDGSFALCKMGFHRAWFLVMFLVAGL